MPPRPPPGPNYPFRGTSGFFQPFRRKETGKCLGCQSAISEPGVRPSFLTILRQCLKYRSGDSFSSRGQHAFRELGESRRHTRTKMEKLASLNGQKFQRRYQNYLDNNTFFIKSSALSTAGFSLPYNQSQSISSQIGQRLIRTSPL